MHTNTHPLYPQIVSDNLPSYSSTITFNSVLCTGLTYTLRKISHHERSLIFEQTADIVSEIQMISSEAMEYAEEIDRATEAAKIEPCSCKHKLDKKEDPHDLETKRCMVPRCKCRKPVYENDAWRKYSQLKEKESAIIYSRLWPVNIRTIVQSVDGLLIDGKPITIDTLLTKAPDGLIKEVVAEIDRIMGLTTSEQLAFELPGTSSATATRPTSNTSADTVNESSSIVTVAA